MNSLLNYGSDEEYEDEDKNSDCRSGNGSLRRNSLPARGTSTNKQVDVNYEEVQMDLSEESDDSINRRNSHSASNSHNSDAKNSRDSYHNHNNHRRAHEDEGSRNRRENEDRKDDRRSRDRRDRDEDRKRDRDDDCRRDDDRHHSRSRNERDRRDKYRGRDRRLDYRERRRSSSRERRYSRSPRRDRRSRSRSKGRTYNSRRYERTARKSYDKLSAEENAELQTSSDKNKYFLPGITGRLRDQIERRKLLWQKKEPEVSEPAAVPSSSSTVNSRSTTQIWETTTFAQDTDGKVANKFKRLMGIKGEAEKKPSETDVLKRQEEMFSSMEQQYEVARTTTHTMRGVGLGFGNFQR